MTITCCYDGISYTTEIFHTDKWLNTPLSIVLEAMHFTIESTLHNETTYYKVTHTCGLRTGKIIKIKNDALFIPRLDPQTSSPNIPLKSTYSGRMCGNNITSRMDGASVNSMTKRSIPMPSPAVGGIPYSKARI